MSIKVRVCVEMAGASGQSRQRADKRIGVSVAEYDGYSTTFGEATEHRVNGTHTVQAAVREAYAGFPKRCLRVKVRRNGTYVLLPGVLDSVEKLLENVVRNAEVFEDIVDSMESEKVRLEIPKFTVDSNTSVKDGLISLGMETAFDASAAFDRLTDADVFVKDVVHAVKIKVDEAGTEAAAATAAVFQTKGGGGRKKDYIDMCVNRKFIFLLKCKQTKALLFAAVVTNPRPLTE
jgi:hypothetical protein